MAYITAEKTRLIKKNLMKAYPEFKFSVRNQHFTSVNVTILSGPVRFMNALQGQINEFHLDQYLHSDILEGMKAIINEGNHDNSDIQSDYFDVGWYVNMSMGSWDKNYEVTA